MTSTPRYPVFIPTRGRVERQLTARLFAKDKVPFRLVVEAEEAEPHAAKWGKDRVLILPESKKGLVYSRNWIKDFATAEGHERHWQFDDDIRRMMRAHKGRRLVAPSNLALAVVEDFVDRYENVALASFNATMFIALTAGFNTMDSIGPFYLNARCYTDFLISNRIPNRWRGRYNEDTDMTLQVLADGHCTMLINAFAIETPATLTASGGQMSSAAGSYQGDGRLLMARELERRWPGIVTTKRRFHRPQHVIRDGWQRFDNQLRLKPGAGPVREYPMHLEVLSEPKNPELREFVEKNR